MSSEDQIAAESVVISAANSYMPEGRLETGISFPESFHEASVATTGSSETQEAEKPEAPALNYKLDAPSLGDGNLSIAEVVKVSAQTMPEKPISVSEENIEEDQLLANPIQTDVSLGNDFKNSNGF